ncbi:opioid-binding protein/cell adhesion molecule homolog [Scylla paramamosain]|uniref:opioid-binding protein/cell adhesion molecule homolog n=1 Tax=Scylla paramamosain TaxID=85552 RepID=UPI003082B69A
MHYFFLPTSSSSSSSSSFLYIVLLLLLLLFPRCRVQGDPSPGFPRFRPHHPGSMEHGAALRPAPLLFKTHNNTDLKAQVGTTAVLHCVAYHVGENTVSWIRRRDYHLLTVGSLTYSSDQRFQIRYVKQENDWQLHIQYVQVRDDGVYECQVSSHPPVSLLTTLHVTEATSEVLGGPEKYVRVGSSLRLVCVLKNNTQPPEYVFWYHGPHMINFHATREVRVEQKGEVSTLYLNHVRASDSGNYTCAPSKARPAHILIHVLKGGETPAAIHSGAGESKEGGGFSSTSSLLLLLVLLQLITLPLTSPCVLVPLALPPLTALQQRRHARPREGEQGWGRERRRERE